MNQPITRIEYVGGPLDGDCQEFNRPVICGERIMIADTDLNQTSLYMVIEGLKAQFRCTIKTQDKFT